MRYVKRWRKNQDRCDTEIASGANQLSSSLEHVPPDYQSQPIFETCPLDEPLIETTDNDNESDWALDKNETTGLEIVEYIGTQNQSLSQSLIQSQNQTQMSLELVCQVCRSQPVF